MKTSPQQWLSMKLLNSLQNYFLSQQKSNEINDTIVVLDNKILGKPKDENDAYQMLKFSGKTHVALV